MPWKETIIMSQKEKFDKCALKKEGSFRPLDKYRCKKKGFKIVSYLKALLHMVLALGIEPRTY